jgi:hypothetical protein
MQPPGLGGADVAVERNVLAPSREALPTATIFSIMGRPVLGMLAVPRYVPWNAIVALRGAAWASGGTNTEMIRTDKSAKAGARNRIENLLWWSDDSRPVAASRSSR